MNRFVVVAVLLLTFTASLFHLVICVRFAIALSTGSTEPVFELQWFSALSCLFMFVLIPATIACCDTENGEPDPALRAAKPFAFITCSGGLLFELLWIAPDAISIAALYLALNVPLVCVFLAPCIVHAYTQAQPQDWVQLLAPMSFVGRRASRLAGGDGHLV